MDTFNKGALDMRNLKNDLISIVSNAFLRITPITILAGLRALVLRLARNREYCATGELHFV